MGGKLRIGLLAGVLAGGPSAATNVSAQAPWTPAPTTPACQPFGALQSSDVVRAARANGGSETTQYLPNGRYVISQCSRGGRLERQQEVLSLPSRIGTIRVVSESLRRDAKGSGFQLSSALFAVDRRGLLLLLPARIRRANPGITPLPPTSRRLLSEPPAAPFSTATAAADRSCSEDEHNANQLIVPAGNFAYEARVSSMPHKSEDRKRITKGHHTWNDLDNPCGIKASRHVQASYEGDTDRTVHTYADGHNVVDFGDPSVIGCNASKGSVVVACTQTITRDGRHAIDIDQRYTNLEGKNFFSTGAPDSDQADLWSVAAHETGHSFGLGHADGKALTMYPTTTLGSKAMRDLGRGDTDGLRCQYNPDATDC